MKYISSILLLFWVNLAFAQKPRKDFVPSAIRVGVDAYGLLKSSYTGGYSAFETQVDIDIHNIFLAVDFGREKSLLSAEDFDYENKGSYYRVGIQANIQPYNINRNVIFFGFRYAGAAFKDKLDYINTTDKFGAAQFSLANDNLKANWLEFNVGMKIKMFKELYFGYTVHFKFGQSYAGNGELTPRNIPGYGKSDKKSAAGFSYYISYRLPFRNKPVPVKLQKLPK